MKKMSSNCSNSAVKVVDSVHRDSLHFNKVYRTQSKSIKNGGQDSKLVRQDF